MKKKILFRFYNGIAWGCIISSVICVIGTLIHGTAWFSATPFSYAAQVGAAVLVGLAWSLPTLVYDSEKLGRAAQILIHLSIGFTVYFLCAFTMQWIPTDYGAGTILLGVAIALAVSFAVYACFYLYYKKQAEEANRRLRQMHG